MKHKFFNGRLSYFFTPRIHNNVLTWVKPASELEGRTRVIENLLRWEDDGGPVYEAVYPLPQVAETKTPRLMDAAGESLL